MTTLLDLTLEDAQKYIGKKVRVIGGKREEGKLARVIAREKWGPVYVVETPSGTCRYTSSDLSRIELLD